MPTLIHTNPTSLPSARAVFPRARIMIRAALPAPPAVFVGILLAFAAAFANRADAADEAGKTAGAGVSVAGTGAKDDDGVEFTVPKVYPKGVPLPALLPNCVRCHVDKGGALSAAVWDYAASAHDREALSCYSCHGGDVTNDEKAHEGNFISGALSKLMDRCGECHARETRFFNESPHHSKKVRFDFPICSTCHDNHSVGRKAVSMDQACASCHGERAKAATGEGESRLEWKSKLEGSAGNKIRIRIATAPDAKEIAFDRVEDAGLIRLLINLPPMTIAETLIAAAEKNPTAKELVKVEVGGDSLGEGEIAPAADIALAGGMSYEEKYPAFAELSRAHDELWRSLGPARLRGAEMPAALQEKVARNRNLMMRLFHAIPDKPDREEIRTAIERAAEIKKEVDALAAADPATEPKP